MSNPNPVVFESDQSASADARRRAKAAARKRRQRARDKELDPAGVESERARARVRMRTIRTRRSQVDSDVDVMQDSDSDVDMISGAVSDVGRMAAGAPSAEVGPGHGGTDAVANIDVDYVAVVSIAVDKTGHGMAFQDLPFVLLDGNALRVALMTHRVQRHREQKLDGLRRLASLHKCSSACKDITFVVQHSLEPVKPDSAAKCRDRFESLMLSRVLSKFPPWVTKEDRLQLIRLWLDRMSDPRFHCVVCAVCSEEVNAELSEVQQLLDGHLDVLTNETLPDDVFPRGYDREEFRNALLDRRGLLPETGPRTARVCHACWSRLSVMKLPPLSLANDGYAGHDALPAYIRCLFLSATPIELSLIARYRVRCTIYKFSRKKGSPQYGSSDATSQRYSQGNAIVFTNGNTELLNILPPPPSDIRETLSVIFVGSVLPSPEEIERMTPLLVRRHVVETLLKWLRDNNPFYSDVVISHENLDALLEKRDDGLPSILDIQLVRSEATEVPSSSYVPFESSCDGADGNVPMSSNGVIGASIEGMPLRDVKIMAMKHWKSGGAAYAIPHGSKPIVEWKNPALFPCMYPHLFPWGIGGPDVKRREPVSMEATVRHLLNHADRQFQTDQSFMFIAMNVIQKLMVYRSARWRVKRSAQDRVVAYLSNAELSACQALRIRSENSRGSRIVPETDEEKAIINLAQEVKMVQLPVPGSESSKVSMRNQIRSLCNYMGLPTFFFTLNPADVHHPLFCKFAGVDVSLDERVPSSLPSQREREMLVARNPVAGAKFFHAMMSCFIEVLLGVGNPSKLGIFGRVRAYYGTIEAQGRGSLHCHMFIWVEGGMAPTELRSKMQKDESFKQDLFKYLDDTISTCLPSNTGVVDAERASVVERDPEAPHPCTTKVPHPDDEDFEDEFARQLERLVYECHYHSHTETCWKNLKYGEPRDDAHCRMRMDGTTRPVTELDTETGSILQRRWHPWINQHNSIITACTRCNSDCKFIGSGPGAQALIYYATDYITKNNLPTHTVFAALQRVLESIRSIDGDSHMQGDAQAVAKAEADRARRFLNRACNALMAEMEVSGQQSALYLLSPNAFDHYSSHSFHTLHWGSFNAWLRRQEMAEVAVPAASDESATAASGIDGFAVPQHLHDAENGDVAPAVQPIELTSISPDDDENGDDDVIIDMSPGRSRVQVSSQVDDYVYRSDGYSGVPLYWFVSAVAKTSIDKETVRLGKRARKTVRTSPRSFFLADHPHCDTHLLRVREKPVVPVLIGPALPRGDRADQYEDYCRAMLLLFKPWRSLSDLRNPAESWSAAFERYQFHPRCQQVMKNIASMFECKDARDAYSEMRRRGIIKHDLITEHQVMRSIARLNSQGRSDETHWDWLHSAMPDVAAELLRDVPEGDTVGQSASATLKPSMDACVARRAVGKAFQASIFNGPSPETFHDYADEVTPEARMRHKALGKLTEKFRRLRRQVVEQASDDSGDESDSADEADKDEPVAYVVRPDDVREQRARVLQYNETRASQLDPEVLKGIVRELGLNREQSAAVGLVAEHWQSDDAEQLLMLVTGAGGTGKSYVVRGIEEMFRRVGAAGQLRKGGPTGCSAYLISAETLHFMLRLHYNAKTSINALSDMQSDWAGVRYLIIDEVSMIGAQLLSRISERLGLITGSDKPFGGLNVIFLGDVRQLPPVLDSPLWIGTGKKVLSDAHTRSAAPKKKGQQVAHGQGLWSFVSKVVTLRENFRQKLDPHYAGLVTRIGDGVGTVSDYKTLCSRLISSTKLDPEFRDAPLITADKSVRDEWNLEATRRYANRTGQALHMYVARDTVLGERISRRLALALRGVSSSVSKDRLGSLPLVKGMRVMVLDNIVTRSGVVNGAEGELVNVEYEVDEHGDRVALCAMVHIPGCDLVYPGYRPGVVPIFPQRRYFRVGKNGEGITRVQLPLIPAYAFTDFKSQGRTMLYAILDLQSTARSIQSTYVMLSRVVKLKNMAVLRPFPAQNVRRGLSADVQHEMSRLKVISARTLRDWFASDYYRSLLAA